MFLRFSAAGEDPLAVLHAAPRMARPFPRRKAFLYALICLLWLGFGLVGRDAWKPDETLIVAAIAERVTGQGVTLPVLEGRGTAYFALAAGMAAVFLPWLPVHEGARLANAVLLAVGAALLWGAARRLYGVRVAWMALLLLVGCFGFVVRAHALDFGVPAFFGMALALFGAAALADDRRRSGETLGAGAAIGLAAAFLLLSVGAAAAMCALLALAAARRGQWAVFVVAAVFLAPFVAWAWMFEAAVWHPRGGTVAGALGDAVRVAAWALLPLLPMAAAGVWLTRRRPSDALRKVCLLAVAGGMGVFLVEGGGEEDFYLLLPPLAVLAAAAVPQLPDDAASVMDFFALLVIGLCVVCGLWGVWLALAYPGGGLAPVAAGLAAQWPNYALPPTAGWRVVAAVALTLGWGALLLNFGRSNERAVVNWSCGVTLGWAVFNLLLAGYVDSGKSYRGPALAVRAAAGEDCVAAPPDLHWRAQLAYYGVAVGGADCPLALRVAEGEEEGEGLVATVVRGDERYAVVRGR